MAMEAEFAGTRRTADAIRRFWSQINVHDNGCWLWAGRVEVNGYGPHGGNGHQARPHTRAYEAIRGPVPAGLQLDHLCRNRLCCNPAHLEPVTLIENVRRGLLGRNGVKTAPLAKRLSDRTHCRNGHLLDERTSRVYRNLRVCRICVAANARAHYRRQTVESGGT